VSDGRKRDDEELESEEAGPALPDRMAASLINPAPGDMPVDPPLTPRRLLPTEDTQ
jgi:hypothetical protein